jgi:hypothetical protein
MPLQTKIVIFIKVLELDIKLEAEFSPNESNANRNYVFKGQTLGLNLPLIEVINGIFSKDNNPKPSIPPEFNDILIVKDLFLSYSEEIGFSFIASVGIANQDARFLFSIKKEGNNFNYALGLQADLTGLRDLPVVGDSFSNIEFKNLGVIYIKEAGAYALPKLETIDNETGLTFDTEKQL